MDRDWRRGLRRRRVWGRGWCPGSGRVVTVGHGWVGIGWKSGLIVRILRGEAWLLGEGREGWIGYDGLIVVRSADNKGSSSGSDYSKGI